jgi:Zn-dependent M16 (insulinase) family peptidase
VSRRLSARLSESGKLGDELYGIEQLDFLRALEERIESDWDGVKQDLEAFRQAAIGNGNVLLSHTGSAEQFASMEDAFSQFVTSLPEIEANEGVHSHAERVATEALIVPSEVNYVGKGVLLPVEGDRLTNAYSVVEKHLNRKFLWEEIRVKGGAYGSFASIGTSTGAFTAASYRDKNLLETLSVYDKIAEHLKTVELTPEELSGMIISAISDVDRHKLPPAKGGAALSRYLMNLDDDTRQTMRDEIFNTTIEDFRSLGELLSHFRDEGMVAVLGPAASAEILKDRFGDDTQTKQVL